MGYSRKPSKERKRYVKFSCYDAKTHDCDGRCQGASDCLLHLNASPKVMRRYMKSVYINKKFWEKIIKYTSEESINGIIESLRHGEATDSQGYSMGESI